MKIKLEKPIVETNEYKILAEHCPHVTESIYLKMETKRLKKKLKSAEDRTRFQIKRELNRIRTRLKRENIWKRLYGESKQETIWRIHLARDASIEHITSLILKIYTTLSRAYSSTQRKAHGFAHKKFPPAFFDLRSLDVTEKGLTLKEWVQAHRKQP